MYLRYLPGLPLSDGLQRQSLPLICLFSGYIICICCTGNDCRFIFQIVHIAENIFCNRDRISRGITIGNADCHGYFRIVIRGESDEKSMRGPGIVFLGSTGLTGYGHIQELNVAFLVATPRMPS